MCLLREILFTGINAFYTQASVGTLSRGLEPAGTCAASLRTLPSAGAAASLEFESCRLEISNVFETEFSSNQDVSDARSLPRL